MTEDTNLTFSFISDSDGSTDYVWKLIAENYYTFGFSCPKRKDAIEAWVQENDTAPVFVAKNESHEFVGFIYITAYHATAKIEIGYMVDKEYRRNGIGTALVKYAENYAKNFLNYKYSTARVFDSEASKNLLKKQGYTDCGTVPNDLRVFIDSKPINLSCTYFYKEL